MRQQRSVGGYRNRGCNLLLPAGRILKQFGHQDAVVLLKSVRVVGSAAAKALRALLMEKNKAQYGFDHPSVDVTKRCTRAMKKLLNFAEDAVNR